MAFIIVVDHRKNVKKLLEQELTDAGHRVASAGNAAETLAQMSRHLPDLIILDVGLPDISAAELLQKILCRDYALPVILYSAGAHFDTAASGLADEHVIKSGNLAELTATVNRLLSKRTSTRTCCKWVDLSSHAVPQAVST